DLDQILAQIEKLEGGNEPKCYATATRLEDFMFGTPLTDNARFHKNNLQKQRIVAAWSRASQLAKKQVSKAVTVPQLTQAINDIFSYQVDAKGHWQVKYATGNSLQIHKDDKRQYASIAYSLRTLLAVQQESLLDLNDDKLPLSSAAVSHITDALDLYTLSVLKIADQQARLNNQFEISKNQLSSVWQALGGQTAKPPHQAHKRTAAAPKKAIKLNLLKSIVEQKVRSYAAYNQISNQLFVRNLQVYFARNRWPADDKTATAFRQLFTETVIAFAADFYSGAQQVALKNGHRLITEADVSQFAQTFIPHHINQYEDAIFFPKLARDQQVTIESYDMDAFRDSGIHWRYLQFAVLDTNYQAYLEPDPFAAELLVENIAQFGVLMLRMTGQVGRALGDKRIALSHFEKAFELIQSRVQQHGQIKTVAKTDNSTALTSSPSLGVNISDDKSNNKTDKPKQPQLFTDITAESGIDFMHRSSDWLNRLLRSYLKTGDDTGTITIPPAFGGSGVAAQDINNDGLPDLLILSGLGNRLYVNRGKQNYEDITKSAGLVWTRESDNQPGEPRQPLIADLDNDGLQDIVITYVNDTHRVYRNLGNEKFADVTDQSGLGGVDLVGGPATVFDFDNDGLLDIYIT
ncbi:MAG: VCBS repeat-containing protein, partial [Psychrosphaera sp.]|nr:VCBS repeat-containing protein [Psychrosphaera sp.]